MKKLKPNKHQQYIDSLYSKEQQDQIKKALDRKQKRQQQAYELCKNVASLMKIYTQREDVCMGDYLILDEKYRLLKKHFNLSDKEAEKIIDKLRVTHPAQAQFEKDLNKGRDKLKRNTK